MPLAHLQVEPNLRWPSGSAEVDAGELLIVVGDVVGEGVLVGGVVVGLVAVVGSGVLSALEVFVLEVFIPEVSVLEVSELEVPVVSSIDSAELSTTAVPAR